MSDLATRLARRALGVESALRPRPAAVFETPAPWEPTVSFRPEGMLPAAGEAPVLAQLRAPSHRGRSRTHPVAVSASGSGTTAAVVRRSPAATTARALPAPGGERAAGPMDTGTAPDTHPGGDGELPIAGDQHAAPPPQPAEGEPPGFPDATPAIVSVSPAEEPMEIRHIREPAPPKVAAVPRLQPPPRLLPPPVAAGRPEVRGGTRSRVSTQNERISIVIGRIDVRAAAPQPPVAAAPRRPPLVSLGDYLKRSGERP